MHGWWQNGLPKLRLWVMLVLFNNPGDITTSSLKVHRYDYIYLHFILLFTITTIRFWQFNNCLLKLHFDYRKLRRSSNKNIKSGAPSELNNFKKWKSENDFEHCSYKSWKMLKIKMKTSIYFIYLAQIILSSWYALALHWVIIVHSKK